jgi:hypothetical protein
MVPNGDNADRPLSLDPDRKFSQRSRWLNRFKYHYNRQQSNQALDGQTPAEEVLNWTVPEYH